MNFDIAEIIRQKQQKQPRTISIGKGKLVDISTTNGTVIVSRARPPGRGSDEQIEAVHAHKVPADARKG